MAVTFTRWTLLRIFELGLCISCLICKRVTDDEASRLFLLLQKLSREWSLLNNITWDKVGAAVADATYGGYIIITAGLLLGNIFGELPTHRRITEMFLIGLGALLFIVLGALEFAALDSVPPELVDNAAILGTLSLVTAGLFLLDLGGPRSKKTGGIHSHPQIRSLHSKHNDRQIHMSPKSSSYETEAERRHVDLRSSSKSDRHSSERNEKSHGHHGHHHHSRQNGHAHAPKSLESKEPQHLNNNSHHGQLAHTPKSTHKAHQNGYLQMPEKSLHHQPQSQKPRRFDIYGKDLENEVFEEDGHTSGGEDGSADKHSPVWSKIRKGEYGKYDNLTPSFLLPRPEFEEASTRSNTRSPEEGRGTRKPASPGDPGYVQYTAKKWEQPGQLAQKTSRAGHSPTPV